MTDRRPLVAANWKMHKTVAETEAFLERLVGEVGRLRGVEVVVCPPFTALAAACAATRGTEIAIAAQNMHAAEHGAYTGEIAAPMLVELGVSHVILGHSERRQLFGETDAALAEKVPAALAAGLVPILCVGETEAERDAGRTEEVLRRQIEADLAAVEADALATVVIAYEPVWAIGTGKTASEEQAEEAIAFIRSLLAARDAAAAARTRILYGGSVKPANAAGLASQPDIDGALVGGASLDDRDFIAIVEQTAAASSASRPGAAGSGADGAAGSTA